MSVNDSYDKPVDSLAQSERSNPNALSQGPVGSIPRRPAVIQNVNVLHEQQQTFGERLADRVAKFGGSWPFIVLFVAFLVVWTALNTLAAAGWWRPFDPFPFIFLNLILSMVAALQAPVILMSQNRQAVRDRLAATLDYDLNVRAENEIMALYGKLDQLRIDRLEELMRDISERLRVLEQSRLTSADKAPSRPEAGATS